MNFRVRKRNAAYVVTNHAIPTDAFVIADATADRGYRFTSNGGYWSCVEHLKYGDYQFAHNLLILAGLEIMEISLDEFVVEQTDELIELVRNNGYFVEVSHSDSEWHHYLVYEKLKGLDDV